MAITKMSIGVQPVNRFTVAATALRQCGLTPAMVAGKTWRKIMSTRICAVALTAMALVTVVSAPASALPISEYTIRRECRLAKGVYETQVVYSNITKSSTRFSTCSYRDINGNSYTDYYVDGDYYSTQP
jgi:hypothetical protein